MRNQVGIRWLLLGLLLLAFVCVGCGSDGASGSGTSGIDVSEDIDMLGVDGSIRAWKEDLSSLSETPEKKIKATFVLKGEVSEDRVRVTGFTCSIKLRKKAEDGKWVPAGLKYSDKVQPQAVMNGRTIDFTRTVGWNIGLSTATYRVIFTARLKTQEGKPMKKPFRGHIDVP